MNEIKQRGTALDPRCHTLIKGEIKMEDILENEQVEKTPEEMVKEMRETMVPKEELEAMTNKYNNLFKNYIQGGAATEETNNIDKEEEYKKAIKFLGDKSIPKTNLQHAEALLTIRDYRMEKGEQDIFLAQSGTPNQEDVQSAVNVANLMSDAIEFAHGSDDVFRAYINEHLKDNNTITKRR